MMYHTEGFYYFQSRSGFQKSLVIFLIFICKICMCIKDNAHTCIFTLEKLNTKEKTFNIITYDTLQYFLNTKSPLDVLAINLVSFRHKLSMALQYHLDTCIFLHTCMFVLVIVLCCCILFKFKSNSSRTSHKVLDVFNKRIK